MQRNGWQQQLKSGNGAHGLAHAQGNGQPRDGQAPDGDGNGAGGRRCPKCKGLILERSDLWVGWERYCVNCGWTPLTVLEAHVLSSAEWELVETLRRRGRALVIASAGGSATR